MAFESPYSPDQLRRLETPPNVRPKRQRKTRAEPERDWIGALTGNSRADLQVPIELVLRLRLLTATLLGQGRSTNFPFTATPLQRQFDVDGQRDGPGVSFGISFGTDFFRNSPFLLTGELNAGEDRITGSWIFRCGGDCSCGGRRGTFRLDRIGRSNNSG